MLMTTDNFFEGQSRPHIYAYTELQYAKIPWTGKRSGKGVIKVGYTTKDVKERIDEQYPVKRPGGLPYKILLDEFAIRDDGTLFMDHDVHRVLKEMNVKRLEGEWFECTVEEVQAAILAVKRRKPNPEQKRNTFKMRPEQEQAVRMTEEYFLKNTYKAGGKAPHFLWNAKMRFGKTFTSYQLAKRMGWKKILVLTFKPAVQSEWRKDLEGHIDFEGWQFVSKDTELQFTERDPERPCVWFASFQDMLGKTDIGGIKAKNLEAHATNWDCIILDEYHFGAWNENSKELYDAEDNKEQDFNDGGQSWFENEDELPLTANHYLYLSGTPFRAMATGEFLEDLEGVSDHVYGTYISQFAGHERLTVIQTDFSDSRISLFILRQQTRRGKKPLPEITSPAKREILRVFHNFLRTDLPAQMDEIGVAGFHHGGLHGDLTMPG